MELTDIERNGTFIGEAFTVVEKGRQILVLSHLNGKRPNRRFQIQLIFQSWRLTDKMAPSQHSAALPARRMAETRGLAGVS